jgi:hypothetical protein
MAMVSRLMSRKARLSNPLSHLASPVRPAPSSAATGKVPYAAARPNEFAVVRCSGGTRLGTLASLALDHSMVPTSSRNDAITRPSTLSTSGRLTNTPARPTLQTTITRLRSQRSTNTPASGDRKKPGMIRALITRLIAAASLLPPMRAAMAAMAKKPIQSPREPATCAHHMRK